MEISKVTIVTIKIIVIFVQKTIMAKKSITKKNYLCMRKDTSRRFTISAQGLEILKKDKGEFAKIKVLAESDDSGKFPDDHFLKNEIKPIAKEKKAESEEIIEVESKEIKENGNNHEPTGEDAEEKKAESEESTSTTNADNTGGGLSEESKPGGNKGELDFTEEDPGDNDDID